MNLKFHHIALSVLDIVKSEDFYTKILGFQKEKFYSDETVKISNLKLDSIILELFEFKKSKPLPEYKKELITDMEVIGLKHFAFTAKNFDATYQKLKSSNVEIVRDITKGKTVKKYVFFKDPNGIMFEIIEE
jgi:glyoxylase I family protein